MNWIVLLCALFMVAVTITAALGASGPQFSNHVIQPDFAGGGKCKLQFYLFQSGLKCDGEDNIMERYRRDDFFCGEQYDRSITAYALAIISSILAGITVFVLVASGGIFSKAPLWVGVALVALICCVLTITWGLSIDLWVGEQCGIMNFRSQGFEMRWGLDILLASWLLSLAALALLLFILVFGKRCGGVSNLGECGGGGDDSVKEMGRVANTRNSPDSGGDGPFPHGGGGRDGGAM